MISWAYQGHEKIGAASAHPSPAKGWPQNLNLDPHPTITVCKKKNPWKSTIAPVRRWASFRWISPGARGRPSGCCCGRKACSVQYLWRLILGRHKRGALDVVGIGANHQRLHFEAGILVVKVEHAESLGGVRNRRDQTGVARDLGPAPNVQQRRDCATVASPGLKLNHVVQSRLGGIVLTCEGPAVGAGDEQQLQSSDWDGIRCGEVGGGACSLTEKKSGAS